MPAREDNPLHSGAPGRSGPSLRLVWYLFRLALVAILPLLAYSVFLLTSQALEQRRGVERAMLETSRAMAATLEQSLASAIETLEVLSTSEYLDSGDLRRLYQVAQRAFKTRANWNTIYLLDASGQHLLNLARPLEAELPKTEIAAVGSARSGGRHPRSGSHCSELQRTGAAD